MRARREKQGAEVLWRYWQLAEYLSMSTASLRRKVREGTIPHVRIKGGRSIRFRRSDIDAWLGLTVSTTSGDSPAV